MKKGYWQEYSTSTAILPTVISDSVNQENNIYETLFSELSCYKCDMWACFRLFVFFV